MSISYGGDTIQDTDGGVLRPISSVMRNRIINGAMVIDQRNAGAVSTPTNGGYALDRWRFSYSFDGAISVQQSSVAPAGFKNSMLMTVTSTDASIGATQFYGFRQRIEGYNVADLGFGTADAKTITASFWVQSSVAGIYSATLSNSADDRLYPTSFTINSANTWEYKTITLAGDTTGTWLTTNGIGLQLQIYLALGSNYTGTLNAWTASSIYGSSGMANFVGTSGATFYITGVQLEVGSSATGFEYRQYTTELQLAQRYFETTFPLGTAPVNGASNGHRTPSSVINTSTAYSNNTLYVVRKRTTPTVVTYNTDNCSAAGQAGYFASSASWNNGNSTTTFGSMVTIGFNFGGTFNDGKAYYTDLHWTASAEL